jgi:hypothetical protein
MSEQLYKKCATCYQFYPGVIGDYRNWCPAHAKDFTERFGNYSLHHIKRTRSIPSEFYDIYWKDEHGEYHRACRACGKHLLKKNGEPISERNQRRWCCPACYQSLPSPNWGSTVISFLGSLPQEKIVSGEGFYKSISYRVQCQRCNKWIEREKAEIHHVKPVSTLTEAELCLIWDFSNLMALCHDCHNGDVHQEVYALQREERAVQQEKDLKRKEIEFRKQWKVLIP